MSRPARTWLRLFRREYVQLGKALQRLDELSSRRDVERVKRRLERVRSGLRRLEPGPTRPLEKGRRHATCAVELYLRAFDMTLDPAYQDPEGRETATIATRANVELAKAEAAIPGMLT
jgi:hypothetical protein